MQPQLHLELFRELNKLHFVLSLYDNFLNGVIGKNNFDLLTPFDFGQDHSKFNQLVRDYV